MADSFFCVDIGESLIKVADVKKTNDKIDVITLGYTNSDPTFYAAENEKGLDNQTKIITKITSSLKITKKNVNVVIPDSYTYSQIMLMPTLNEKELISAIKYQADQFIPMPIEETNIDIEVLQEFLKEKKQLILMVASPKKLIDKVQQLVERAGLLPNAVENELSASARFINETGKSLGIINNQGFIVVNIGWLSTSLYYFDPISVTLLQNHNFKIGYNLFLKEIQINTNLDTQKSADLLKTFNKSVSTSINVDQVIAPILTEFLVEIKRFITLIAEKQHVSVKSIYLINDIFRFPSLSAYLQEALNLANSPLNAYPICNKNNFVESYKNDLSVFTSAMGGNFR